MNKSQIYLFEKLFIIILLCMISSAYGKVLTLKDGSVIKVEIIDEDFEKYSVKSKALGSFDIYKKNVKFSGSNPVRGLMLSFTQLSEEKENSFDTEPMFSYSSASAYDEKVSTCFDLGYFYRNFEKKSEKYLNVTKSGNTISTGGIVDSSNYEYKAHFITPSLVMRLNILPNFIQEFLDNLNMFPYIGLGIGYGLSLVNYSRIDTSSFKVDSTYFNNKDIDYKPHIYGGLLYKGLLGISYKISSRATLVFEFTYQKAIFEQYLKEDEKEAGLKSEKFTLSGISPSLGIRFGIF